MAWLEMLRLRRTGARDTEPLEELLAQVRRGRKTPGLTASQIYRGLNQGEELMIALHWGSEPQPWGSELAQALARELKQHGLVDHAVWVRLEPL